MAKRIIFGVLLAAGLTGFFFLRELVSPYFMDGLILAALFLCLFEMIRLFKEDMTVPTIVVIALYAASVYPAFKFLGGMYGVLILSAGFFILENIVCLFDEKSSFDTVRDFIFMMFYPVVLISFAFAVNASQSGTFLLALAMAVSVLSDTFALFFGVLIKGPKLCPQISPKKTIAGAVGGIVGGVGGGIAVCAILGDFVSFGFPIPDMAVCAILGFIGSVMTQLGDLVASNLKRKFGVKDFGNLIPGHGGVVDRLDGVMFNLAATFAFMAIFAI